MTNQTLTGVAGAVTEEDVQRYAQFIAGHPDAVVDSRHLAVTRAVLGGLAQDGRLLTARIGEDMRGPWQADRHEDLVVGDDDVTTKWEQAKAVAAALNALSGDRS